MRTVLIMGGAGFIGSNLVHHLLAHTPDRLVIVDKLTYAGSLLNIEQALENPRVTFVKADIADDSAMTRVFADARPDAVLNLAAETHVDRSIDGPAAFVQTNVVGAFVLIETARAYWNALAPESQRRFRFVHISTDEVYGTLGAEGAFTEDTAYAPNSPYAASKASADHFVRAYWHTFGLPVIITNCSNNYGPYQFPEKLIPLAILNAIEGRPVPIYGDGCNVRDWLHVEDHCAGLLLVLDRGEPGGKYNLGGSGERTNLQVVDAICAALEMLRPAAQNPALSVPSYSALKAFVPDRPGHDRRYAIDASRIRQQLGWRPRHSFEEGLTETVRWYLEHLEWCDQIQAGRYDRGRLGLGARQP